MKHFDAKWQAAAAQARHAARQDETAPFGFAARVAARVARPETVPLELAWDRFALRLFASAVVALAICLALEGPHWRDARPLEPGIENAVARLVWSL